MEFKARGGSRFWVVEKGRRRWRMTKVEADGVLSGFGGLGDGLVGSRGLAGEGGMQSRVRGKRGSG